LSESIMWEHCSTKYTGYLINEEASAKKMQSENL